MVVVYHDTAQGKWTMEKPINERGESSWTAQTWNPDGLEGLTVRDEHAQQEANRLGVINESNEANMVEETSSGSSNDFTVIV